MNFKKLFFLAFIASTICSPMQGMNDFPNFPSYSFFDSVFRNMPRETPEERSGRQERERIAREEAERIRIERESRQNCTIPGYAIYNTKYTDYRLEIENLSPTMRAKFTSLPETGPIHSYHILGVPQDASEEIIKTAFKKLSLATHKDRNRTDSTAEIAFRLVDEARKEQLSRTLYTYCHYYFPTNDEQSIPPINLEDLVGENGQLKQAIQNFEIHTQWLKKYYRWLCIGCLGYIGLKKATGHAINHKKFNDFFETQTQRVRDTIAFIKKAAPVGEAVAILGATYYPIFKCKHLFEALVTIHRDYDFYATQGDAHKICTRTLTPIGCLSRANYEKLDKIHMCRMVSLGVFGASAYYYTIKLLQWISKSEARKSPEELAASF